MNYTKIINEMRKSAAMAADFIQSEAQKFTSESIEYKGVNDLVSYVDKEAEFRIVTALKDLLPEAGFITEEGTMGEQGQKSLNWIIDPLDGTANFVHGLPHYSVSIALAEGKTIIAGVVHHVSEGDSFWAARGMGAFKNQTPIRVSEVSQLEEGLFAIGFPYYKFDEMSQYLQILESLMQKTHGLRRFGSAALDLAYVAAGVYEGFFEYNLNSWDMAAGVILVEEAGGKVTDFQGGNDYLFGGDVVAGGAGHQSLLSEIQKIWTWNQS